MPRRKFSGFSEEKTSYKGADERRAKWRTEPERRILKIGPGGRLVIPADFRKAMEVEEGDRLVALLEDGELRLTTSKAALRQAQAAFRKYVPKGSSVVDDFLAERKAMWGEE